MSEGAGIKRARTRAREKERERESERAVERSGRYDFDNERFPD